MSPDETSARLDAARNAATRSPIRALTETLAETQPAVTAAGRDTPYPGGCICGVPGLTYEGPVRECSEHGDGEWVYVPPTDFVIGREEFAEAPAVTAEPTLAEFEAHLRRVHASAHLPEDAALTRQALNTVINFRAEHTRVANIPWSSRWFPEHDVSDEDYRRAFDAEVARLSAKPEATTAGA